MSPGRICSLFSFEGIIFFSQAFLDNCIEEANGKKKDRRLCERGAKKASAEKKKSR